MHSNKKSLPLPRGPYAVSYVDLMTEFSKDGIFLRLLYPTLTSKSNTVSSQWIPWVPHDMYVRGMAIVVGVWVFVVRLAMWWYGGHMHIPIVKEAQLLPLSERGGRKMPIVIFSHGFGATRFLCSGLLTELASRGYLVASLEHRDSSANATYYYQSEHDRDVDRRTWIPHSRLQFGAQNLALRQQQVRYRRSECIQALNLLEEINKGNSSRNILKISLNLQEFEGQMDLEQVTMMGHSFGGATSLLTLNTDHRFKQGVILDCWMFPVKDDDLLVTQPLLFINSPTFHIASNLSALNRLIRQPTGATRRLYIIRNSTHETQTDTPLVLGYWLDNFKPKIDPVLGGRLNAFLIIKFLHSFTGFPGAERLADVDQELTRHRSSIIEDCLPDPAPVRKGWLW